MYAKVGHSKWNELLFKKITFKIQNEYDRFQLTRCRHFHKWHVAKIRGCQTHIGQLFKITSRLELRYISSRWVLRLCLALESWPYFYNQQLLSGLMHGELVRLFLVCFPFCNDILLGHIKERARTSLDPIKFWFM
jgi:hypothetical protein